MFIERRELWDAVGWLTGLVVQRGLRLGVLPGSRGGRVVHEQIEGGVDRVFVHAAGALRGLQAVLQRLWKFVGEKSLRSVLPSERLSPDLRLAAGPAAGPARWRGCGIACSA